MLRALEWGQLTSQLFPRGWRWRASSDQRRRPRRRRRRQHFSLDLSLHFDFFLIKLRLNPIRNHDTNVNQIFNDRKDDFDNFLKISVDHNFSKNVTF